MTSTNNTRRIRACDLKPGDIVLRRDTFDDYEQHEVMDAYPAGREKVTIRLRYMGPAMGSTESTFRVRSDSMVPVV